MITGFTGDCEPPYRTEDTVYYLVDINFNYHGTSLSLKYICGLLNKQEIIPGLLEI